MSKKTKIDPKLKTIFDLTDKLDMETQTRPRVEVELHRIPMDIYYDLEDMARLYDVAVDVVVNGLLKIEINRRQGLQDEK